MREHSQSIFLVEGLQPSWLGKRARQVAYGTMLALSLAIIIGLRSGLIGGLSDGLSGELRSELSDKLIGLLLSSLIFGVFGGLGIGSLKHVTLVETISWKWNQFWKRTIPGSIVGLIFGLIFSLGVAMRLSTLALFERPGNQSCDLLPPRKYFFGRETCYLWDVQETG